MTENKDNQNSKQPAQPAVTPDKEQNIGEVSSIDKQEGDMNHGELGSNLKKEDKGNEANNETK